MPSASKKKGATASKRAARSRVAALSTPLAEAAWAEADAALAEALIELDRMQNARGSARADATLMLAQALARIARKRGLTRIGSIGARAAFDPERHEREGAGAGQPVRVVARGVARGAKVLAKARVAVVRRSKRA